MFNLPLSIGRVVLVAVVLSFGSIVAVAQDDYNRAEGYGAFTLQRIPDVVFPSGASNGKGFMGGVTFNVSRFAGIKTEFSYNKATIGSTSFADTSFMGGIQLKDNSKEGSKVRPFAHVLGGISHTNDDTWVIGPHTENNLTMAFGGGLDFKVSDRMSIRAIQVDYKPTFGTTDYGTLSTMRFGFGVVFH